MTIQDLKDNDLILFECISGSKAYGLDTPESDTDIKGIFYLPKEQYYSLDYIPQVSDKKNDTVYYEIGRFIELLQKNNPNILEVLSTPEDKILIKNPIIDLIKLDLFISKLAKFSFGGYAFAQIKKARGLNKKISNPIKKDKKSILNFCFIVVDNGSIPLSKWLEENEIVQNQIGLSSISHCKDLFAAFYDPTHQMGYKGIQLKKEATSVCLSSIPKGEKAIAYLSYNEDAYKVYCKEYKEYWDWVKKRNVNRYNMNIAHGKNYDSKNMMHTFRLLDMAKEILSMGKVIVERPNREDLLSIRNGEKSYEELIELADKRMQEVEIAYLNSSLPEKPNADKIKELLINIRLKLYS